MTDFRLDRPLTSYARVQRIVSRVIRNRRMFWKPLKSPLYVDIGCGPKGSPDFYNIDYSWVPGIDRCQNLDIGLDLPAASVDGVYTEHCFEHLDFGVVVSTIESLYRAMRPGAILRIVMPDAERHARAYLAALEGDRKAVPFGDVIERDGFYSPVMSINACMREHGHRFIYDFDTLRMICEKVGFSDCRKVSFREGSDATLLKDSPERELESLYFEATR